MRLFLLLAAAVTLTAHASAQVSLAPPTAAPDKPATPPAKPATAEKPKIKPLAKKPATPPAPPPAATATPAPEPPDDPNVDLVYGAYQRGLYKTAFDLAMKRAQEKSDPKAMTMLGELYANAFGVARDDAKAVGWYKRAADAGDREAMFELAMLRLAGRGGPVNR
ncbi:tetratricopeptide repeat protein, partial [Bradyrhizobium sp.]